MSEQPQAPRDAPEPARSEADLRPPQQTMSLQRRGLPAAPPPEVNMPQIDIGFDSLASFEFTQRAARLLAMSTMVPDTYRQRVFDKRRSEWKENDAALPNCVIALNMARRLRADPIMVMQNLHIIEGRPSWSAQFVISAVNSSGRYTALKFRVEDLGEREVEYTVVKWVNRQPVEQTVRKTIRDQRCVAWASEKTTGELVEGPEVTIEMAIREGWYGKSGSKWQTMPGLMIRYRAAAFFGRLNAPELLMGLPTDDELSTALDAERDAEGVWAPTQERPAGLEPPRPPLREAEQIEHAQTVQTVPTLNAKVTTETAEAVAAPVAPRVKRPYTRRAKPEEAAPETAPQPEATRASDDFGSPDALDEPGPPEDRWPAAELQEHAQQVRQAAPRRPDDDSDDQRRRWGPDPTTGAPWPRGESRQPDAIADPLNLNNPTRGGRLV